MLAPYALLALVYFGMGFLEPNYMVNEVHISQPYNLEHQLFGIATADGVMTPSEWFAAHHSTGVDLLCGMFYMLWIRSASSSLGAKRPPSGSPWRCF